MEYQVPQFIEVEDKIFGPFTLRQFIYLAGGAGACVLLYLTLPFYLSIIPIIIVGGFAAALAFYRLNNKPFIDIVEAAVGYFFSKRLYLWRRADTDTTKNAAQAAAAREAVVAKTPQALPVTQNKLRDLAWSLDVQDRAN